MDKYSKLSIKSGKYSTIYNFDKNGWEEFLKHNVLSYMNFQRAIDYNHVDEIVTYLNSSSDEIPCFLTTIVIGLLNNKYYIIDGQHRICALKKFKNKYSIIINLVILRDEDDLNFHLKIVNCNKPYTQVETNDIKQIEQFFLTNYKEYIKNTNKPRCPHINTNNIVKILNKHNSSITFDIFLQKFKELESFLVKNHTNIGIFNTDVKQYFRNKKEPFYCGIMKNNTWLDAIIISIECDIKISSLDFTKFPFIKKRDKIAISDKNKLWKQYNNTLEGKCYICNENITYNTFECGHIVPVFKGGTNSLSNMKCICRDCNKDCGIMNLEEYKLLVVNN